jgi:hypothetical protein
MREPRLGDDIDDFCVRCKRVMNHAVVSVINATPAKVRCRTCHSDHDFRHEQAPPPKVDARKAALYNEVLKKVDPQAATVEIPEGEILDVTIDAVEADGETDAEPGVDGAPEADGDGATPKAPTPPPPVAASATKAKAKAKGRSRK